MRVCVCVWEGEGGGPPFAGFFTRLSLAPIYFRYTSRHFFRIYYMYARIEKTTASHIYLFMCVPCVIYWKRSTDFHRPSHRNIERDRKSKNVWMSRIAQSFFFLFHHKKGGNYLFGWVATTTFILLPAAQNLNSIIYYPYQRNVYSLYIIVIMASAFPVQRFHISRWRQLYLFS